MRKLEQKDDEWEVGIEEFLAAPRGIDAFVVLAAARESADRGLVSPICSRCSDRSSDELFSAALAERQKVIPGLRQLTPAMVVPGGTA